MLNPSTVGHFPQRGHVILASNIEIRTTGMLLGHLALVPFLGTVPTQLILRLYNEDKQLQDKVHRMSDYFNDCCGQLKYRYDFIHHLHISDTFPLLQLYSALCFCIMDLSVRNISYIYIYIYLVFSQPPCLTPIQHS